MPLSFPPSTTAAKHTWFYSINWPTQMFHDSGVCGLTLEEKKN